MVRMGAVDQLRYGMSIKLYGEEDVYKRQGSGRAACKRPGPGLRRGTRGKSSGSSVYCLEWTSGAACGRMIGRDELAVFWRTAAAGGLNRDFLERNVLR